MSKHLLLLAAAWLSAISALAQGPKNDPEPGVAPAPAVSHTVTGRVTDATGEGMAGVSVILKGGARLPTPTASMR